MTCRACVVVQQLRASCSPSGPSQALSVACGWQGCAPAFSCCCAACVSAMPAKCVRQWCGYPCRVLPAVVVDSWTSCRVLMSWHGRPGRRIRGPGRDRYHQCATRRPVSQLLIALGLCSTRVVVACMLVLVWYGETPTAACMQECLSARDTPMPHPEGGRFSSYYTTAEAFKGTAPIGQLQNTQKTLVPRYSIDQTPQCSTPTYLISVPSWRSSPKPPQGGK